MYLSPLHFLTCRGEAKVQVSFLRTDFRSHSIWDIWQKKKKKKKKRERKHERKHDNQHNSTPNTVSCRPSAPKIPDGEKVDFDVSRPEATTQRISADVESFCWADLLFSVHVACRTSRRNVRTRTWLSCRPSSMPTLSAGRRRRRSWSPSRTGLWVFSQIQRGFYAKRVSNSSSVFDSVFPVVLQEKRRAERAEQQRVRAEKEKERQARREVRGFYSLTSGDVTHQLFISLSERIWSWFISLMSVCNQITLICSRAL